MKKAGAALTVVFVAAIAATSGTARAQDKPLDHVSMRFGYVATGNDTFWAYGRDKGFFRDEGIDVELREGKGSATTLQAMAAGGDDFAVDIDGGAFLGLVGKGLPAVAVMAPVAKSPIVLLSPADKPLKTPAELVGKQIAIAGGSGAAALLPVFLKKNGIDESKVSFVNMQSTPLLTTLLSGRVDAAATNVVVQATLRAKGLETVAMRYADFGLVMPGQYLVASPALVKDKPDLVRRMVRAMRRSMQATIDDPQAAADAFHRAYPAYDAATALAESRIIMDYFRSPAAPSAPLGAVSLAEAREGYESLRQAGIVTGDFDLSKSVVEDFAR
jgi:NitT/TauT family transport system substrate-binding protein